MFGQLKEIEIKILDQLLEYLPDYGGFQILSIGHSACYHAENETTKERFKWVAAYHSDKENHENHWCFDRIQRFLLHHGYCKIDTTKSNDHFIYVELTQKGRDLKEVGNYYDFSKNLTSDTTRIRTLERESAKMARRQHNVNVWIAVGTCVAASYNLIQIVQSGSFNLERKATVILLFFGASLGVVISLIVVEWDKRTK